MATFDDTFAAQNIKWSMEIIDKGEATLYDSEVVPYYTIRFTFVDGAGNVTEHDVSTWCPEATAVSLLGETVDHTDVEYKEADKMAILATMNPGDVYGTIIDANEAETLEETKDPETGLAANMEPTLVRAGVFSNMWRGIKEFFSKVFSG